MKSLIHKINKKEVNRKLVYSLFMSKPIKTRMYKQSEWLHDNFYHEELNNEAHLYMSNPKRN